MKIYVQANSKKEVNSWLASGIQVYGYNYSFFDKKAGWYNVSELEDGDIVVVFSKIVNRSPVAKSWGSYDSKKNRLK